MGEKGIASDAVSAGVPKGVVGETTSVIERAGTVVTTSVTNAGGDVVEAVRAKALDAAAEGVVSEGRERLADRREQDDGTGTERTERGDDTAADPDSR
jgi:hypothetical protein